MANNKLWSQKIPNTYLEKFSKKISKNYIYDYKKLHKWSIDHKEIFWNEVWEFTKIIGIKKGKILKKPKNFIQSTFFEDAKINFAENCLAKDDESDAIIYYSEKNIIERLSWNDLKKKIFQLSYYFKKVGIKKNDRIAAVLPNFPETIISFLATSQIGAIWSSCSADFGAQAIIERFKQINPKLLIITDKYYYNGKLINTLVHVPKILKSIPTIKKIILIPYEKNKKKYSSKYILWKDIFKNKYNKKFIKFNFNHPLYILYSSGTTGKPKCIVHGSGGTLIQHKKEHQLHLDIKENDKVFFFTTCGWMMWNWLITCLSSKAKILLYDGSPFHPKLDTLINIVDKEKVTFFGVGAKYLDHLKQNNFNAINKYKLKNLKTIASTGSPLIHETFDYVYKNLKKNIHLASISGGTDIVSCFVLGNPLLPVYSGEIQCAGLGMDIDVFDQNAKSTKSKTGELVCKSTFPSKPIYFWKDPGNKKYKQAYFMKYKNIWHHGDFCKKTKNNGFIIYGRSDATLNAGGIRIGTAEIYRVVERMNEIEESVAVEHNAKNNNEVILFVKLKQNLILNIKLEKTIRNMIKKNLSPKYVPAKIFSISDIPKTKSGKIVELTIKNIMNGKKIDNLSSLSNSDCLIEYQNIYEKLN